MGLIDTSKTNQTQQKAGTTTVDPNAPLAYKPPPRKKKKKKNFWESGWEDIEDFGQQAIDNVEEVGRDLGEAGEGLIRGGIDVTENILDDTLAPALEWTGENVFEPIADESKRGIDRLLDESKREMNDFIGLFSPGEEPEYEPQTDPRLQALQDQLASDAKKYEEGSSKRLEDSYGLLAGSAGQNLQRGQSQLKEDYGRRGGLYGGSLQKDLAGRRAEAAGSVAKGLIQSRIENRQMIDKMKLSAMSVGLDGWAQSLQAQSDLFNINLANEAQRREAMSNLGRGLGAGIGAYAGYKAENPGLKGTEASRIMDYGSRYGNPTVDYNLGGNFDFNDNWDFGYSNPYSLR